MSTGKTALILGASGLIGRELCQQLLADDRYTLVRALVRKPLGFEHPKLEQQRYDFDWPDADLVQGDELFCCLGTTIKTAGSQAAFRKVDYDYVIETAKMALYNGCSKMVVVSSLGANKDSNVFYSKIKGEMEATLSKLKFEALHIMRPSLLLGSRSELRMGELVGKFFATALSFAIPKKYKGIEGAQVAKAMIHSINSDRKAVHIFESDQILDL